MINLKSTITKVVVSEILAKVSKKSTGTRIATKTRDLPITIIKPISK